MTKSKRKSPEDMALPRTGVDTHAHLDMPELRDHIQPALQRARESGLQAIGNVFLGPGAYRENRHLFADHPEVFFILGVHPHDAQKTETSCMQEVQAAVQGDPRIKALGEMGLDYFRDYAPHQVQRQVFQAQLELAKSLDMPVVIHSRAAEEETLQILDRAGFQDRPLLWHCFGGDAHLAREVLGRGWMISVPGTVTFAKAPAVQQAVAEIPVQRLVLETDCPFLAPEPYRGKRNEPALTVFTAHKVAQILDRDPEQVWARTGDNARDFFQLPDLQKAE